MASEPETGIDCVQTSEPELHTRAARRVLCSLRPISSNGPDGCTEQDRTGTGIFLGREAQRIYNDLKAAIAEGSH